VIKESLHPTVFPFVKHRKKAYRHRKRRRPPDWVRKIIYLIGPEFVKGRQILTDFIHCDPECPGHPSPVCRIGFQTIGNMSDFNLLRRIAHGAGRIFEQELLLFLTHQVEKGSRL